MLNGLYPLILFNFSQLEPEELESLEKRVPLAAKLVKKIGLPPIPLYLSEQLTGIYIDVENKNIDIETDTETLKNGQDPEISQKGLISTVTIEMKANRNSIGLTLILAMSDLIFKKATSREYSITYLNGAVTVFNGLLHSFAVNQSPDTTLYHITMELIRRDIETIVPDPIVSVPRIEGSVPL